MTENARPRTTVGQWLILATLIVLGAMVAGATLFAFTYLGLVGQGIAELGEEQTAKEAICIPYTNGVLELASLGYSSQEITAAYEAAAVPVDDETGAPRPDEPASWAIHYCGDPAAILETTAAARP